MMDDVKAYPPYLDYPKPRKPMTNADRIRAMSDEELAKTLNSAVCPPLTSCNEGQQCIKCWIDWLQRPAGEEDKHELVER